MKLALLSKEEMLASDLLRASFAIRSARMTPDRVSHLVLWLVFEFLYGGCAWPASAAAHAAGVDRYVEFLRADGRLAHAVLACEPQRGAFLSGDCVDVMGRRSLESIYLAVESEIGTVTVSVAAPVPRAAFGSDERLYLSLAEELPWFREAMGMGPRPMDGERLTAAAVALGYVPDGEPELPARRADGKVAAVGGRARHGSGRRRSMRSRACLDAARDQLDRDHIPWDGRGSGSRPTASMAERTAM